MKSPKTVVLKLGGSLLDLTQLKSRLEQTFDRWADAQRILVVGGGPVTDFIEGFEQTHQLGEKVGHTLALHGLLLNSRLICQLTSEVRLVSTLDECRQVWRRQQVALLNCVEFLETQQRMGLVIPIDWQFTTDSIAAVVARECAADELVLLKSVDLPTRRSIDDASQAGLLDRHFPQQAHRFDGQILWINLRAALEPVMMAP